ncbi:alpha/beta hydrolase family protein [Nonomuraea polychroma]|uniref:Alpha/beta hydrolase family protein n=1 Tax=Nonomuraea polychroma TaxID=46176 RepID=A0A438LZ64_9ACTN|nr:alpha/beta fold hydrolase [Nonomuraea polychroma]RVX38647.1 alpha/beta hydrolase family protein [Nonomuraea polychroma]
MTDPLATDPPRDPRHPAVTPALTFDSGGASLPGVLHVPAGKGPHPVVVLLHGFPGNERNFDLAQVLRRAGYASLVFHYRGSWGAGGSWSWSHVLQDTAAVVAGLRDEDLAAAHRLDPRRVMLIGHSLGGFAALMTAAAQPSVAAVASVAGFDFGTVAALCRADPSLRKGYVEAFAGELGPLRGTSGEALVAEVEAAGDSWRLAGLAPLLADRPVLLIGTSLDTVTPHEVHHEPLVAAYQAQPIKRLEHHVFATDHALSDHRVTLARTILSFLSRCP